jgi:hypothetical protein
VILDDLGLLRSKNCFKVRYYSTVATCLQKCSVFSGSIYMYYLHVSICFLLAVSSFIVEIPLLLVNYFNERVAVFLPVNYLLYQVLQTPADSRPLFLARAVDGLSKYCNCTSTYPVFWRRQLFIRQCGQGGRASRVSHYQPIGTTSHCYISRARAS